MLGWIIQVTAVSLCFIAVIHYLYIFFKTTLTVPKVKDLVNRPQQQYDELFKGLDPSNVNHMPGILPVSSVMTTNLSSLPPIPYTQQQQQQQQQQQTNPAASAAMKDELKQFVKKLNGTNRL
jgi:hypothetical protein